MKVELISDIEIETIREDIRRVLLGGGIEVDDEKLGSLTSKVIVALNNTFEAIKSVEAKDWVVDEESNMRIAYIGTQFVLSPSGKYYTLFTSNQDYIDVAIDSAYNAMIERREINIGEGEGCPTDWYVSCEIEVPEEDGDWEDEPRDKDYNDYTEEDNEFWRNINKGEE